MKDVMEVVVPFRDSGISKLVVRKIRELAQKIEEHVKIMTFCGTHEWTIIHYGIRSLMPENVELVAGPGCPVCITPAFYVDAAIKLALEGIRVFTFGDSYKLPGSSLKSPRSLEEAKAERADVRIVYSVDDAIKISKDGKESVFLGVGFETTTPSTVTPIHADRVPANLSFIIAHRLTPPIMRYEFDNFPESPIRGVIAPGHVSTITGASAWEFVARDYQIPVVVSGFEPLDVLFTIWELLKQNKEGRVKLVNEYSRAVSWEGSLRAKRIIGETCDVIDAAWRGIGFVPESGLRLKDKYRKYDALMKYGIQEPTEEEWRKDIPPGCRCAEVTLGLAKPTDCPLFMKACTPDKPYGPCMVSSEGTCFIWAKHGGEELLKGLGEELLGSS